VFFLAILKAKLGDSRGACDLLARYRRRAVGEWGKDAERLMAEYDCESVAR
jgi:hypothetical protein